MQMGAWFALPMPEFSSGNSSTYYRECILEAKSVLRYPESKPCYIFLGLTIYTARWIYTVHDNVNPLPSKFLYSPVEIHICLENRTYRYLS